MMLFFCTIVGLFLAALPNVLWLIGWVIGKMLGYCLPYRWFGWTALLLVVSFYLLMAYGYYIGRFNVEVKEMQYSHASIPKSFDGFRIVHISDMHLSTFDDAPEELAKIVERINGLSPDLICFTGDMVTIGKKEALPYTNVLKRLNARNGVVSVLGNHDFMIYAFRGDDEAREESIRDFASYQTDSLGWHLLRNEHMVIHAEDGSMITILGVDNACCKHQGFKSINRGDLAKAIKDTDGFRILLSHDPSHWSAEVVPNSDIPLTLSGHTHSAQIRIFGWTPAKYAFTEVAGEYSSGDQTLYINVGLGCTAPFRIGVNPEITLITLKADSKH